MKERCRRASADRMLIDAFRRGGSDPLWRVQQAEYSTYLPGDLLPKVDIASMAVSLEARSPLLDHRFVELAASPPTALKWGPDGSKLALRDALRGVVPDAVLDGPKRGFGVPVDEWMRSELAPMSRALLGSSESMVRQVIEPSALQFILDAQQRGRQRHGVRIFALLCLELWFRTYIESPPPLEAPAPSVITDFG